MNNEFSESEKHGLEAIPATAKNILSVGISTGGVAEIEMAKRHPDAHIIATTIDDKGINHTRQLIRDASLEDRIEAKIEDVSESLPYRDGSIDFIYARLVLHYLTAQKLDQTLAELRRIMRPGAKLYIVVRSTESSPAKFPDNTYNEETKLTTYSGQRPDGTTHYSKRYFHTVESIGGYTQKYFSVDYVRQYDEKLYLDFERTIISAHDDNLIELLVTKEV